MRYLGLYEVEYLNESETVLVPIGCDIVDNDTTCNYYDLGQMMACTRSKEFPFDGSMCLSNSGGVAIQIQDTPDIVKMWMV